MSPAEIAEFEIALGWRLPSAYARALQSHGLSEEQDNHPEFITDPGLLLSENKHLSPTKPVTNAPEALGPLRAVKSFLMFGSPKAQAERRQAWELAWVTGRRFIVGSDLGEERYFIVLSEVEAPVYCYELETKQVRQVAASPEEWVAEVRRRQEESEGET